jgi:hypothetical protein
MHLFGDSSGPHLAHFHAHRERDHVELEWELRNAPLMQWRVLRSEREFAETADALPGSGQTVVMKGTQTHATDDQAAEGTPYFYSVFAEDEAGVWQLQVKVKLEQHDHHLHWHHGNTGVVQGPSPSDVRALALASYPSGLRR